jgi:hypothetical protein
VSEELHTSGEEDYQVAADHDQEPEAIIENKPRTVPLDALQSERATRQRLEEENRLMKENLALLKAAQDRQPPPAPPKNDLEEMNDDDILTVKEFKNLSTKMSNQFKSSLVEIQMAQKYPDYQEVITKYLPEVIKTNPNLRDTLQKTQDYELAYYLAKNSEGYRNSQTKVNPDAERILKNSQSSGGLSSVGASTPVSQAKRYKDMSNAEFESLMRRNRA